MRAFLIAVASVMLAGCPSLGNVANETIHETPDVESSSKNSAPVFNIITINRPGAFAGRDMISGENPPAAEGTTGGSPPSAAGPDPETQLDASMPAAVDGPTDKGGETVLVGPLWGGMTAGQHNRVLCSEVPSLEREEPVDPVWRGCRAYWEIK